MVACHAVEPYSISLSMRLFMLVCSDLANLMLFGEPNRCMDLTGLVATKNRVDSDKTCGIMTAPSLRYVKRGRSRLKLR